MGESMTLPKGLTCADCNNVNHCVALYGVNKSNTECDFHPIKFVAKLEVNDGH